MNFFTFQRIAEGYAAHRPYYHPIVVEKIRKKLQMEGKLNRALDVGCGTGLSTISLQEIAHQIIGTDSSEAMIMVANQQDHLDLTYHCNPAEEQPFEPESFDLITVCGAINWIDRSRFLPEAKRLLVDNGWLVIYDNFITSQMQESTSYNQWYHEQFLVRYPKPPRDETLLTAAEAEGQGFHVSHEIYTNELLWSREQYVEFMLTQSNVIAAVDMGEESLRSARTWMHQSLMTIIPEPYGTFLFEGFIWYLQLK